ncbi:hypothetical protein N665_0122s0001 [Sinapis alba]|nr:hypothetical protein N665_0482s0003 [Sinapis alba]KAF8107355.1 hypothetical protein N665_0122s0001 [Sinapis alba]
MNLAGKMNIPVIMAVSSNAVSDHRRHVFRENRH